MAIASNKNTPRNTYTATAGQTAFTIGFEFFKVADVKVYKNGSLLTYNANPSGGSQYKITGTASASDDAYEFGAGGTVTLGAGASVNDSIVIIRDILLERTSDFPSVGAFDITSLNTQLDTLTSMVSDIKQQSDRSVKLLDTDTVSATITLPAKATRQDKILSFDANGNIETTTSSSGLATISGLSSEISTLGGMASTLTSLNNNATNINNVAGALTNINQVASNLSSVSDFANIYLGANSSAPTQDPDGSSLDDGDLYFDTTSNQLKVYASGSGWQNAGSSVNGTSNRFTYTISGTPTTVSGNDNNGNSLTYDAGFIDVYLNGVKMVNASDVTVTSGSSVVFAQALSNGDTVDIITFGTFSVSNINAGTSITSGTLNTARLPIVPTTKGGTGLSSIGTAGQVLKVNAGANALEYGNASSAEVYGFNLSYVASTINYTVSVTNSKFIIMGETTPTLELYEGNTYVFTYPSGHPFRLSTTSDGTHGGGSEYTTGITHNSSTQTTFVVPASAPQLYYYCANHSGHGGTANTPVPFNNNVQVTTTNQGQDNISAATYAGFDDVLFSASGFTFSLNNGDLIATI